MNRSCLLAIVVVFWIAFALFVVGGYVNLPFGQAEAIACRDAIIAALASEDRT